MQEKTLEIIRNYFAEIIFVSVTASIYLIQFIIKRPNLFLGFTKRIAVILNEKQGSQIADLEKQMRSVETKLNEMGCIQLKNTNNIQEINEKIANLSGTMSAILVILKGANSGDIDRPRPRRQRPRSTGADVKRKGNKSSDS